MYFLIEDCLSIYLFNINAQFRMSIMTFFLFFNTCFNRYFTRISKWERKRNENGRKLYFLCIENKGGQTQFIV